MSSAALFLLPLLTLTGCAPTKPHQPLPAPTVELQTGHYTGSVLSGPLPANPPVADPLKTPSLQVTFFALENLPITAMEPLGSQARLIAAARGREPVLPTARLTLRSRVGRSDDSGKLDDSWLKRAGRSAILGSSFAAVPSGMTAWFRVADVAPTTDIAALQANVKSLELRISRRDPLPTPANLAATMPATTAPATPLYEIALLVDDLIPAGEVSVVTPVDLAELGPSTNNPRFGLAPKLAGAGGSQPAARAPRNIPALATSPDKAPIFQREIAVLDGPALDRAQTLMFLVPLNLGNGPARVVAIRVQTQPAGSSSDDPEKLEAVRSSIEAALQSRASAARPAPAPAGNATWSAILVAMRSLERADVRRSALLYLATQTQGILAADAILASDDTVLEWFAQRFVQLTDQRPVSPAQPQELGWLLDLATWQVLSEMLSNQALPRELSSILVVHAGESARRASSLEEVLSSVPNRTELRRRLILENQVFLEDSSPSSRIRAMEWLTTQSAAPANYDPMATLAQRRAALEKAQQQQSQSQQPSPPQPDSQNVPVPKSEIRDQKSEMNAGGVQ